MSQKYSVFSYFSICINTFELNYQLLWHNFPVPPQIIHRLWNFKRSPFKWAYALFKVNLSSAMFPMGLQVYSYGTWAMVWPVESHVGKPSVLKQLMLSKTRARLVPESERISSHGQNVTRLHVVNRSQLQEQFMHAILLSHLVCKVKFYCRQRSHLVTTQPLLVPLRHCHNLPVAVGDLHVHRENKTKIPVLLKLCFLHRI